MMKLGLLGIALLMTMSAAAHTPIVKTASGKVSGVVENGVNVYKGIPYAAPPVGDLRWRQPQPVKSWKGVRACDKSVRHPFRAGLPKEASTGRSSIRAVPLR